MGICVVTDSSAVMPRAWMQQLPLHIVALDVAWRDGTTIRGDSPYADIAEHLTSATPPTTGAASPEFYSNLLEETLATNDGVLIVCPSAEFSRTYESATLAGREVGDDRVRVLDAGTAAAGQGLVAAQAAIAARSGADIEAVTSRAVSVASKMQIWATLSQLEFLRRSGRMPAVTAIGGALRLQPIVRYAGSSPAPVGVTRSAKRATDRLYKAWERSITADAELHAVVFHSARASDATDLHGRMEARRTNARVDVVEVTASLAAHTGPGLLGVAWFWDN